jgi:hypothetical protein
MMWNLVMQNNFTQAPFYDGNGKDTEKLVNGKPYNYPGEDMFMSGQPPFEASSLYSKDLKDLIRECLQYLQTDRPAIEDVKRRTAKGLQNANSIEDVKERTAKDPKNATSGTGVDFKVSRAFHSFRLGETWPVGPKQRQCEENREGDYQPQPK